MRYRIYTALLILMIAGTFASSMADLSWYWVGGECAVMLFLAIFLFRSVHRPLNAVENGMYLIRDQDFSSRLRLTGQPDADKIVELYNTLIASMKAERLKSLEQNKFLSLVVDASPLGIAVCNYDGEIVDTNRAWDAMQSPALTKAIDSVGNGDTQTLRLADALIVRISKLWFMDSGFKRNFILVERLTDEIAAAEKEMFNKIIRTIGHEVNNTLGSVISILDSLGEMHKDEPFTSEAIASASGSCTNLVSFVRGYADIVKLPPASPENTELNEWMKKIYPTLSGMAPANISVRFSPLSEKSFANIDRMLMERVMINIVKNSIESIGACPDGMVDIAVSSSSIIVTDNGKGISDEVSGKLFTPFFSTKQPDRGLGLMLITDILRAHSAHFSLSTSHKTGLTTFAIDFCGRKQ